MPPLIRLILREFAIGGTIGAGCWTALIFTLANGGNHLGAGPVLLGMWGFTSLFGIGYLATGLALLPDESDGPD